MIRAYQIPLGLADKIIDIRTDRAEKRRKNARVVESKFGKSDHVESRTYSVNKDLKPLITFCKLKSLTSSGIIKQKPGEFLNPFFKRIAKEIGISFNTLKSHLEFFKKSRLMYYTTSGRCICLSSWTDLTSYYGFEYYGNHKITSLNPAVIYGLAYLEKESYCKIAYTKKAETLRQLGIFRQFTGNEKLPSSDQVHKFQVYHFMNGILDQNLHLVNPRFGRTLDKIRCEYGLKSLQSVYYWLDKINSAEVAEIYPSTRIYSRNTGSLPKTIKRGWDPQKKQSFFVVPTSLKFNEKIFLAHDFKN